MNAVDGAAIVACADLACRSGAKNFELGYMNEPPLPPDWWAKVQYRGAALFTGDHSDPARAADALARRILTGGRCTHCRRTVSIRRRRRRGMCNWRREGERWIRGCE